MENGNSSSSNSSSKSFPLDTNILIFTIVFSIQFIFAVVENSLIVWIVCKDSRLKTNTNYLVANMAVSDVLAAFSLFPLRLVWINFNKEWLIGGHALCKLSIFIIEVSLAVSVYSCLFIAIDRYYAIAYPLKKPSQFKIKVIIALTWTLSSFFKAPIFYFFDIVEEGNKNICVVPSNLSLSFILYYYSINAITVGMTLVAVTVLYALIVYKLYRQKRPGTQNNATLRRKELQNRKVLKISISIVALFYLSWGTRCLLVILRDNGNFGHLSHEAKFNLENFSYFMLYMSLVYNFFIYLIFNSVYSQNLKALITKCCCYGSTINSSTDYFSKQSNTGKREGVSDTADIEIKDIQEHCSA